MAAAPAAEQSDFLTEKFNETKLTSDFLPNFVKADVETSNSVHGANAWKKVYKLYSLQERQSLMNSYGDLPLTAQQKKDAESSLQVIIVTSMLFY